ncbi:cytochrome b5-like heme/steroid-binding domain protein (macronuclear) [Tetrahymena thermophila SB210]|uniref:Cytochrome b5-like heme/steroid-binding domain protein n=1 Tax=Tetrahymena thermophila (strain SB210) TaxID=312017 RepID=I7MHF1_TETTS|nr:cytochrome b5-like heme/steroid-binding domain protein [Tetrahymena thermophila SB210]EAR87476.1 cytochrome b5-like heme/steroid-binding domain protein [Tetrahymena thermophila SB210]|eukprot:XP_001007721.1 cytochrome b5-like heme/steroid-binding domain protein [Tetrahymena thermophila SB210]
MKYIFLIIIISLSLLSCQEPLHPSQEPEKIYNLDDSCLIMEWGMIRMCWIFTETDITIRMQYKFDGSFFFQITSDEGAPEGQDRDLIELLSSPDGKQSIQDSYLEGSIQVNDEILGGKNNIETLMSKVNSKQNGKLIRFKASKKNLAMDTPDGAQDEYTNEFLFKRDLNTNDQYDRIYTQGEVVWIKYFWTSEQYFTSKALQQGAVQFPFENGYNGMGLMQWPIELYQKIHFWVNFTMWGIVIDIANCAARFFKTKKYYMHVHGYLMLLVCASTLTVEMWTLIKNPQLFNRFDQLDDLVVFHFLMGFIFMIVMITHLVGGYILYLMLIKNKTGGKGSQYFKLYHQVFGYILYLFGKAGNVTGFKVIQDEYTANVCIIVFSLLIGLRITLEAFFIFYPRLFKKILFIDPKQKMIKDIEDKKLSLISKEEKIKDIVLKMNDNQCLTKEIVNQYDKTLLVIFDNGIYDIKNMYHPGGNFIIKKMKGREIGRFMYGAFGLETSNMAGYEHSKYAYDMLEQYYIGEIENIDLFLPKQSEESNNLWRVAQIQKLDNDTSVFFFIGKDAKIKVQKVFQGLEWLGRHFVINDSNYSKHTRQYTNVLSFSNYHVELRKQLLQNYNQNFGDQVTKNSVSLNHEKLNELKEDNLFPMVIKKYPSDKGFSQHLHENTQDAYYIRGPYSRGLELSAKSEGEHLFICGGTGVLPFYDLLDYLFKYMIYKSFKTLDGNSFLKSNSFINHENTLSQQINIENEDYENNINPNLKIKVFASFMSVSQSFGAVELLNQMMRFEKENNLQLFSCIVKVSKNPEELQKFSYLETTSQQFSKEFIYTNANLKQTKRVFICGPPILNKSVYNGLVDLGYEEMDIMLV